MADEEKRGLFQQEKEEMSDNGSSRGDSPSPQPSSLRKFSSQPAILAGIALLAVIASTALLLPSGSPSSHLPDHQSNDVTTSLPGSPPTFGVPPTAPGQPCLTTPTLQYCDFCLSNPYAALSVDAATGRIKSLRACLTGDCEQSPKDALAGGEGVPRGGCHVTPLSPVANTVLTP